MHNGIVKYVTIAKARPEAQSLAKGWRSMTPRKDECTYRPGEGTCWRPDCPRCCVRNFRDQFASDVPVLVNGRRRYRTARQRQPRLARLLARLRG